MTASTVRALRIWLLNPYGPIPGEGWREYRFSLIARALARRGHEVTWWTASFAHHFKTQRTTDWQDVEIEPGYRVRLVPTPAYRRNIGVARIAFEMAFARRVDARSSDGPPPDLIVSVEPPQVVSSVARHLADRFGARLHIDILDLWPELFETVVPAALRGSARLVFWPLRRLRARNLRSAALITAACDTYAGVARQALGADAQGRVQTIYIGVDAREPATNGDGVLRRADAPRALALPNRELLAIYAGSLGSHYDIQTLVAAARLLRDAGDAIRIVVAGNGPLRPLVERAIESGLDALHYLGTVHSGDLWSVYRACHVGLCTYGPGSTVAFPVKAYDYLAAGLPILSSLQGELATLLREHGAGVGYSAGSPQSLADALRGLAADDLRLRAMARAARALGQTFDARAQYDRLADLVESVALPTRSDRAGSPSLARR
jgi:glycosyltransferase involved in cell wall biosynthesis